MITFVTGNKNKLIEIQSVLGDDVRMHDIDLPEIQSLDFSEVIKIKLQEARKHIRDGAVMVEDAGYTCNALGKIPGPFSKFFLQELGRERVYEILQKLGDTKAVHTANIGYMDERGEIQYFTSSVKGEMVFPKGESGFGFDPLFVPDGYRKTFAEMTDEERFSIKPRVACAKMLREYLQKKRV